MAPVILKESVADFTAAEDQLNRVRSFVQERLVNTPLDNRALNGILVAVEEVFTNIIRHGYLYSPGLVRLSITQAPDEIVLEFRDTGREYQWATTARDDYETIVETGRRGSLGMHLVERVVDHVSYERTRDGENVLQLLKRLHPEPPKTAGMSLRWRWVAAGMVITTLVAFALFFILNARIRSMVQEQFFAEWRQFSRTLAAAAATNILNRATSAEFDELVMSLARPDNSLEYVVITDGEDVILADTRTVQNIRTSYQPPANRSAQSINGFQLVSHNDTTVYYLTSPIHAGPRQLGAVHVLLDTSALRETIRNSQKDLAFLVTGGLLVSWGLLVVLTGWFIRPIRRLAEKISGHPGVQGTAAAGAGGEETQRILGAFDAATQKITEDKLVQYQQELSRRERKLAEDLQQGLAMSKPPAIPGYEFGTAYQSAHFVGGDWFDIFRVADGKFVMGIGDVSGKGVSGALIMSSVRTAVRILAPQHKDPLSLVTALNDYLTTTLKPGMFVTMFIAYVSEQTGEMEYVSAGHTPMLHWNAFEEKVIECNPPGRPLGLQLPKGISFDERIRLGKLIMPEDGLCVFYTDGAIEARNAAQQSWGAEKLKAEISQRQDQSAQTLTDHLVADIIEFVGEAGLTDDLAIVTIKRKRA